MKGIDTKNYVRFREVAIDDIPKKKPRKVNKWEIFITEFIDSGFVAAEIDIPEGSTCKYQRDSLHSYLNRISMRDDFNLIMRDNKLYIINKELSGEKEKKPKELSGEKEEKKPKKRPGRKPKKEIHPPAYHGESFKSGGTRIKYEPEDGESYA